MITDQHIDGTNTSTSDNGFLITNNKGQMSPNRVTVDYMLDEYSSDDLITPPLSPVAKPKTPSSQASQPATPSFTQQSPSTARLQSIGKPLSTSKDYSTAKPSSTEKRLCTSKLTFAGKHSSKSNPSSQPSPSSISTGVRNRKRALVPQEPIHPYLDKVDKNIYQLEHYTKNWCSYQTTICYCVTGYPVQMTMNPIWNLLEN